MVALGRQGKSWARTRERERGGWGGRRVRKQRKAEKERVWDVGCGMWDVGWVMGDGSDQGLSTTLIFLILLWDLACPIAHCL